MGIRSWIKTLAIALRRRKKNVHQRIDELLIVLEVLSSLINYSETLIIEQIEQLASLEERITKMELNFNYESENLLLESKQKVDSFLKILEEDGRLLKNCDECLWRMESLSDRLRSLEIKFNGDQSHGSGEKISGSIRAD